MVMRVLAKGEQEKGVNNYDFNQRAKDSGVTL